MKSIIVAASALALSALAVPAFAQVFQMPPTGYVDLGVTRLDTGHTNLDEITGRAGLRFGSYVGVEGELGTGIDTNSHTGASGTHYDVNEQPSAAIYGVGYWPVTPRLDLLVRVGYGETGLKTTINGIDNTNTYTSVNYGAGAQYFLTAKDGVRFDYTRRAFASPYIKDGDTYALSYVRKF
jgi:hypothetical protein